VSSITEDQELLEVYQAARDAAMAAFAAAAMGEPDMVKEYEEKLTKREWCVVVALAVVACDDTRIHA
jgi:hypothetical protein